MENKDSKPVRKMTLTEHLGIKNDVIDEYRKELMQKMSEIEETYILLKLKAECDQCEELFPVSSMRVKTIIKIENPDVGSENPEVKFILDIQYLCWRCRG